MRQRFFWLALGVFTLCWWWPFPPVGVPIIHANGASSGSPVKMAAHHEAAEAAEEMTEAAEGMVEAAEEQMPEAAGPIDINMADAAALQTLPGIGETKAAAIIAHREANGPFATVDDLQNVKGIGEKTLEKLKEQITAGASE